MISNTFPFQKSQLKHSSCVASFEGTGGVKSENISPVCTKIMKKKKIRAATAAGCSFADR